MSKRLNLHGRRFGKLTAIRTNGRNASGQLLWECVCACGRYTVTASSNLVRGTTKSCGCLAHAGRDLSGRQFGKLTAIRRVEKNSEKKSARRDARWLCTCACGRETITDTGSLLSGNTKSCGNCSWGRYENVGNYVVGHFEDGHSFLIDLCDCEQVKKRRWWRDKRSGYFVTSLDGRLYYLHRFLLLDREGFVCDHRNRDKADNRRSNLRYATPKENARNRSIGRNNTSGYIGVCWHVRQKKYVTAIKVNNRTVNLGSFHTAEDAARARDKAALYYFGSFANLNFGGEHESKNPGAGQGFHAARLPL